MTVEVQIISSLDGQALDARHAIQLRARVQMFDRNDPPNRNQVWTHDNEGRLRCGGPDGQLALEYRNGELRLAEVVGDRPNQQWDFVDGQLINRAHLTHALQVIPPFGREAQVVLAPSGSGESQKWSMIPVADPSLIVEPGPWDGGVDD